MRHLRERKVAPGSAVRTRCIQIVQHLQRISSVRREAGTLYRLHRCMRGPGRRPMCRDWPALPLRRREPPATERPWPPESEGGGFHMRHYEVMVILDPDLEERAVAPLIESFLAVVRNGGGKVEKVDTWGRRRLSYEIKKKPEGIYSVLDLTATPEVVKE